MCSENMKFKSFRDLTTPWFMSFGSSVLVEGGGAGAQSVRLVWSHITRRHGEQRWGGTFFFFTCGKGITVARGCLSPCSGASNLRLRGESCNPRPPPPPTCYSPELTDKLSLVCIKVVASRHFSPELQ